MKLWRHKHFCMGFVELFSIKFAAYLKLPNSDNKASYPYTQQRDQGMYQTQIMPDQGRHEERRNF